MFQTYDSFYRLLAKACALDPSDRFATVDELRAQVLGVLREVVATDRGPGSPALHSAASVLFEAPTSDEAGHPLAWDQLPALKVDASDPAASWLAGVNVSDPAAAHRALADAPEETVEVRLRRTTAAIEAGRAGASSTSTIAQILEDDPWEWRAAWLGGLAQLSTGDPVAARASFNAVYGQVPGELAPKLALATACELSGEPDIAESLYIICARSDANYTAPAAFGLARIRRARGDLRGALARARPGHRHAQLLRGRPDDAGAAPGARRAATSRRCPTRCASVQTVSIEPRGPRPRCGSTCWARRSRSVLDKGPSTTVQVGGVPAQEPELRDALEAALRESAVLNESHDERIALVDQANEVRRWTTW